MKYTILGSRGFIGSHVTALVASSGHDLWCPRRTERLDTQHAGHIIYCVGMTADFRQHPHQTIDAHVTFLQHVLKTADFDSLTYLSSTRVYQHTDREVVHEDTPLVATSQNAGDLYNLSKLLGENLLLQHDGCVRVARLSNVVGHDVMSANFLFSVIRDCVLRGEVCLQQTLASAKDYVDIQYVAELLLRLGPFGTQQVYNIASGYNVSHSQIIDRLTELTGAQMTVSADATPYIFPRIDTRRVQREFQLRSADVVEQLPDLVDCVRQHYRTAA